MEVETFRTNTASDQPQAFLVLGGGEIETPEGENRNQHEELLGTIVSKRIVPDAPRTPERAKPGSRINAQSIDDKNSLCDPGYSTPSAKRGGLFTKPVRRRLDFSSESMDDSSSDSFGGGEGENTRMTENEVGNGSKITALSAEGGKVEKEEEKAPPRKIAQLVVWTNKSAGNEAPKLKEPLKKEVKKEKEEDLFVVQYPARPFADQGKGKGKPFRRLNSYNDPIVVKKSPPPAPPAYRRRGGEKRKRGRGAWKRNTENAGVPVGYFPNQGVVVDEQTAATVAAYQAYLQQFQQFQQLQQRNLYSAQQLQAAPEEFIGDSTQVLVKVEQPVIEVAGPSGATFSLPEQFTVTETQNEFDLLIQNVVHEEMVNDMGDEEFHDESSRKRIRLEEMRSCEDTGPDEPGKPRCTYTELIEKALSESGGLTVSEIYNWISEHYPYFKQDDDRWKNSVRHNLSINPYFKKGEKARSGAGHLWTISEESRSLRPSLVSWDERRKSPCDPGELQMSLENETDRAVANILGIYRSKMAQEKAKKEDPLVNHDEPAVPAIPQESCQQLSAPILGQAVPNAVNLSEVNTGQFTVDLSGINIPEGGAINFDELISNGRLIYIETATDPEANKENDVRHGVASMPDNLLSEVPTTHALEEPRYSHSYFHDPSMGLEGFASKSSEGTYESGGLLTMVPPSDIVAPTTTSDFTLLDQCLHPLDSYESTAGCATTTTTSSLAAALFESKELGIPYTFQVPTSENLPSDLL